jgi:hypothetical protein
MEYLLAKQLKDAGFKADWCGDMDTLPAHAHFPECFPTLEELIEACAQWPRKIRLYGVSETKWLAELEGEVFGNKFTYGIEEDGSTPTEAVARLWLALNAKAA